MFTEKKISYKLFKSNGKKIYDIKTIHLAYYIKNVIMKVWHGHSKIRDKNIFFP